MKILGVHVNVVHQVPYLAIVSDAACFHEIDAKSTKW